MTAPILIGSVGTDNLVAWDGRIWRVPQALGPTEIDQPSHRARPGVAAYPDEAAARQSAPAPTVAPPGPAPGGTQARYLGPNGQCPRAPGEWRFCDLASGGGARPPAPGEEGSLGFACLRGTGWCGTVRIGNGFKPAGERSWQWNGDTQRPTLSPSINCLAHGPNGERYAGCGWHAHLNDGVWGAG